MTSIQGCHDRKAIHMQVNAMKKTNSEIFKFKNMQRAYCALFFLIFIVVPTISQPIRNLDGITQIPNSNGKTLKTSITINIVKLPNGKQFLGCWFKLTNTDYDEEFDIIVCSMVNFAAPEGVRCKKPQYGISKDINVGEWTCYGPGETTEPSVSYHFGCKKIHIGGKNDNDNAQYVIDGWFDVTDITCILDPDPITNIQLSERADDNSNTWDYMSFYVDILKGDGCDLAENCQNLSGQNLFVFTNPPSPPPGQSVDYYVNAWATQLYKIKLGNENPSLVSSPVEVGNWVTMGNPDNYPSRLVGRLYGMPSGTVFSIIHPKDTLGSAIATDYDTSTFIASTLSGCTGDTIDVNIDFMVTPYPAIMRLNLTLPNDSCGNYIRNGHMIQFIGDVISRGGSSPWDSGAFMYGISAPFIFDTTAPQIDSIQTTALNDTTIEIKITASDDTSMVDGAWIIYRVNNGSNKGFLLRYENNMVGNSTTFVDTLRLSIDSATLMLKAVVRNALSMTDTSAFDTINVYSLPILSVPNNVIDYQSSHYPNPSSQTITIQFFLRKKEEVSIDIYSYDGTLVKQLYKGKLEAGNHEIDCNVERLVAGSYFYQIKTNEGVQLKKIQIK